MFGVHADLRRRLLVTMVPSAAVAITGIAALVLAWRFPSGPPLPFVMFAAAAFWVSYVGLITTPRWYRYASRVVASTEPVVATIVLEGDTGPDSRSLYASLRSSAATFNGDIEHYPLLIPRSRVEVGAPIEARMYRDPLNQQPVAFEVGGRMLWCMPYRRTT